MTRYSFEQDKQSVTATGDAPEDETATSAQFDFSDYSSELSSDSDSDWFPVVADSGSEKSASGTNYLYDVAVAAFGNEASTEEIPTDKAVFSNDEFLLHSFSTKSSVIVFRLSNLSGVHAGSVDIAFSFRERGDGEVFEEVVSVPVVLAGISTYCTVSLPKDTEKDTLEFSAVSVRAEPLSTTCTDQKSLLEEDSEIVLIGQNTILFKEDCSAVLVDLYGFAHEYVSATKGTKMPVSYGLVRYFKIQ